MEPPVKDDRPINEMIKAAQVRLIGAEGEQIGVVTRDDALDRAANLGLDLVIMADNADPPVCKIMDYGKFKYEAAQKVREARKNQVNTVLKTVRFGLKIDAHDYETKAGQVRKFLRAGDKVKVMVVLMSYL
jgi:translation initiation factor IF-3